jgi:hypothetical protein
MIAVIAFKITATLFVALGVLVFGGACLLNREEIDKIPDWTDAPFTFAVAAMFVSGGLAAIAWVWGV